MSEKLKIIPVTRNERLHEFFCDTCGVKLGESYENDDGYYEPVGEMDLSFYLLGEWWEFKGNYCEKCKKEKIKDIQQKLKFTGFKINRNKK